MNLRKMCCTATMALLATMVVAAQDVGIYDLKVNGKREPIGIDSANPVFSWKIATEKRNYVQPSYQIEVQDEQNSVVWNSQQIKSDNSIGVKYEGAPLKQGKRYTWQVRVGESISHKGTFVVAPSFEGAQWIALEADDKDSFIPTGIHTSASVDKKLGDRKVGMYKLPLLRKDFQITKKIKKAITAISGLGHFELYANGRKVGDHFLDPGWSDYKKEALYVSFDITNLLNNGANTLGIMLGNGFYNVPRERYFKILLSLGAPKAIAVTEITYEDGTTERILTDNSWQANSSAITYSSIYGGEDYDARLFEKEWSQPAFDASKWQQPTIAKPQIKLTAQKSEPLKVRNRFKPVRIYKNSKGNTIYDFGQNMSGIVELQVKAKDGTTLTLHPGELLNPDSTVNQSASGAPFYYRYTTASDTLQQWAPRFTYYGFRYVELEKNVNIDKLEITALHTTNSAEEVGNFYCSSQHFNQIYQLIDWSVRSNIASVLTDCPHREKLGWLEVAHLMQYSIQYRYNLSTFYQKILDDIATAQHDNGMVPTIAPEYVHFEGGFENTPEWGSAFIVSAWYNYQWYGDKSPIEKYYDKMSKYVDYLTSRADNHIVAYGLGDWYDLGPGTPGYSQLTTIGVTSTAIYYYDVKLMQQMAQLLGKNADVEKFKSLSVKIKDAFNKKYFDPLSRKYDRNSQAANAMALYVGLVEEQNKETILANLVDDITSRNYALTAGDVGYRYVLRTLDDNGLNEVVYRMNSRYDVPGYGWQLSGGATSLTESWQNYGFVSNNHCMLGHLMEWLFSALGGIKQAQGSIAFKELLINPTPVSDVNSAQTSLETPYGRVECRWESSSNEGFSIDVTIPAGCSATVVIPCPDGGKVSESGRDVKIEKVENNNAYIKVGSGHYKFIAK